MKTYKERKAEVRMEAIDFQGEIASKNLSWGEIATYVNRFIKLGRRYGLLREFYINEII